MCPMSHTPVDTSTPPHLSVYVSSASVWELFSLLSRLLFRAQPHFVLHLFSLCLPFPTLSQFLPFTCQTYSPPAHLPLSFPLPSGFPSFFTIRSRCCMQPLLFIPPAPQFPLVADRSHCSRTPTLMKIK